MPLATTIAAQGLRDDIADVAGALGRQEHQVVAVSPSKSRDERTERGIVPFASLAPFDLCRARRHVFVGDAGRSTVVSSVVVLCHLTEGLQESLDALYRLARVTLKRLRAIREEVALVAMLINVGRREDSRGQ